MPTWMPSFLNPVTAGIAAAIVAPLLILLYFLKLRRREVEVSSTILWKKAIQDLQVNSPFQRLRRNLLLLLQLLLLLLLALALSRPVVNVTPPAGAVNVLLIDRSASMSARDMPDGATRLDEARKRAKDLIDSMPANSGATVISFDDQATTVMGFTSDTLALKQAIDSITPSDRPTRLKMASQLAQAQASFNPEQLRANVRPDVYIFSDGRVEDAGDTRFAGQVHLERIGTDKAGNIAIVAMSARRNYERPTEVQIFARMANYGTAPARAPVQLSIATMDPSMKGRLNFQVVRVADTFLMPDQWNDEQRSAAEKKGTHAMQDSVEFKVDLDTAAVIRVQQQARTGDMLPADDVAQVVVPPPKPLRACLVTEGNYFLERAFQSLNLHDPKVILPAAFDTEMKDNGDVVPYDVVVFDRVVPAVLPPSGNFIWVGALPRELSLQYATGPDGQKQMLTNVSVLDWQRDHPMLRHLAMGRLWIAETGKLKPSLEDQVLVDGSACPLVVLHREKRSTHLVIAFDLLQSNWPTKVSFPMFMNNAMQFMAIGSEMDVRQSLPPGSTPQISRALLERAGPKLSSLRLIGPEGTRDFQLPQTGEFALPALEHVGIYQTDPVVPQFEAMAVNLLDPSESNLVPADIAPGGVGEVVNRPAGKRRMEMWWWIVACCGIPLLVLEWWVYTRRLHA